MLPVKIISFNKMIDSMQNKKVKFLYFEPNKRPIKCSGYIYGANSDNFKFRHLKFGRSYLGIIGSEQQLPINSVRFRQKYIQEWIDYAKQNCKLQTFLDKHVEHREKFEVPKEENKFNVILDQ